MKKYWLFKSEPSCYSIDDLKSEGVAEWDGVRNYQARNLMRDEMKVGDLAFFYHSSTTPTGIVGICRVFKEAHPDHTAWDPAEDHYDAKSSPEKPIWKMVSVEFIEKFPRLISLDELRAHPELDGMTLLTKGSRLSIQPVTPSQYTFIKKLI